MLTLRAPTWPRRACDRVDIRVGPALETLPRSQRRAAPLRSVFIDADKPRTAPEYFERSLRLSRPGSLIIVDNVVRSGELANAETTDENVQRLQRPSSCWRTTPVSTRQ